MNTIKINSLSDFNTMLKSHVFFSKSENKELEIQKNTWAIMLNPHLQNKIFLSDLQLFFTQLIQKRKQQIKHQNIYPITFYAWYDDQVEQLCFNICSLDKKDLPFGCKINFTHSLDIILKQFLYTDHHGGIFPIDEIVISNNQKNNPSNFILDVYALSLS